ncbi:MAG: DUF1273 domain-containing protein [Defluviitaleaceae bacterium]|nr:DUF1273 domain-containing protein [Defluviitaleaceae bacterium]
MEKTRTVCFSGHRRVDFDMDDSYMGKMLQNELIMIIKNSIKSGFNTFCTGMAQGFDIIAAEAVLKERYNHAECIKLICIIPYRGQENKWGEKWKRRYDNALKASDDFYVLNDRFVIGCYHERNRFLVDNSSRLVGLHSGKTGGTEHTFKYAQEKGLEIINLWDKLGDAEDERTN